MSEKTREIGNGASRKIDDGASREKLENVSDTGPSYELTYEPGTGFHRYINSLKNLIPFRRKEKETGTMAIDSVGLWSIICFSWITNIMYKAHSKGITMDELPSLSPYDGGTYNAKRLKLLWEEELASRGTKDASFSRVAWRFCRTRTLATSLIFTGSLIASFLSYTYVMRKLLEYVQYGNGSYAEGAKWVLLLITAEMFRALFGAWARALACRTALRLRSACLTLLYEKMMSMDDVGNENIGKMINMFANDANKIFDVVVSGPLIVGAPISTVFGVGYLLWLLGPMSLLGMIAFLLFFPVQYVVSRLIEHFQTKAVTIADMRVRLVNEILDCVKLIKMYAWEKRFSDDILDLRKEERRVLLRTAYCGNFGDSIALAVPAISAIITFLTHVAGGNNLIAAQVFSYTTLLDSVVRLTLYLFQEAVRSTISASISFDRMKSLLLLEGGNCHISESTGESRAVAIINGTFAYDSFGDHEKGSSQTNGKERNNASTEGKIEHEKLMKTPENDGNVDILFDISFEAAKGKLVGICGPVGSGKSSLLLAALGQLRVSNGQVMRNGSCAYVSQQAWITNATLKENILFGEKFDESRYFAAIYASNLGQDIDMMPGGDQTEIGEKGVNLSGGQKQRVALARALYADRDIYFLDDPLSAVDARVGAFIFDNFILGDLKGKTVLFVTHQIQYLNRCDEIYMMRDGKIIQRGTHDELMEVGDEYALMVAAISFDKETNDETIVDDKIEDLPLYDDNIPPRGVKWIRANSVSSMSAKSVKELNNTDGQLMVAENLEEGTIKAHTYHSYIMAAGGYFSISIVILTFIAEATIVAFGSWWLAIWIEAGGGNTTIVRNNETILSDNINDNPDFGYYRTIYASVIGVIILICAMRSLVYAKATIRASTKMHNDLFKKMITSPMRFFDTTPSGRIQHLFSRDVDEVDTKLPPCLGSTIDIGIALLLCIVVICAVFPWFILPMCVLAVFYYLISRVFRVAIRDLKRMDNKARALVISFVTASVEGLSTIRAFGKEKIFITQSAKLFDENSKCLFLYSGAMRWLAVRIDTLSVVLTGITAFFVVALQDQVSPSFAGLALTFAMQVADMFQYGVGILSETEVRFINVERLNHYIRILEIEGSSNQPIVKPPPTWPAAAEIKFSNVCMAYGDNAPNILKRISITINAGENIGIVGRTGSGKSSLTVALFRLVELAEGKIEIDGVDISEISLTQLRTKLSIIPQDPVLFSGTIRSNLDPFKLYTDAEIWKALEKTELKGRVQSITGQLDASVGFGGDNLSVGERQLLCLARALLRNSKILVLDEATAAVDPETEIAVQNTIQHEFSHCTILTIAHRLRTVLSLNRILVMDSGQVLEFDTPSNLLGDPNSEFSKMMAAAEDAEGK